MSNIKHNKCRLLEEIRKIGNLDTLNERNAERLMLCALAYDALCKVEHEDMEAGYATKENFGAEEFSRRMAERWTAGMENADGSRGPHWTMEQTKAVQAQYSIDADPLEFWVAINSMYSDYYRVAVRHNVNNPEFYAELAHAFLSDKDAQRGKMARYYEYIVRH
jgi:hypothetical protein